MATEIKLVQQPSRPALSINELYKESGQESAIF